MNTRLLVVALVAACGGGGDKAIDAPIAVDAAHVAGNAMSHTLFVNTEGVTLMQGADDATANKTSLIATTSAPLKAWRVGDAARATKIANVLAQLHTTLAPYGVDLVTTRPAAGPYDMLVVTDDQPAALGSGFIGVGAITATSCNATPSVIAVVFPVVIGTTATDAQITNDIANLGIAMFGILAGIPVSSVANDCMCLAAAACNAITSPCTIGGAGTMIDTGNGGAGTCGDTDATMDEGAKFLAAFGSH